MHKNTTAFFTDVNKIHSLITESFLSHFVLSCQKTAKIQEKKQRYMQYYIPFLCNSIFMSSELHLREGPCEIVFYMYFS
jgi:hypothetical protein